MNFYPHDVSPARFPSIFHGIIAALPQLSARVFIPRNLNLTRAIRLIRIETFYARSTKKKKKKKRRRRKKKKWRRKREGGGSTGICKAVGESPNAGTDARHREQIFLPRDEDRRNHRFPLCRGIFNLKGAISSGDDPCLPLLLDRVSIVPLKRMMEERI